MSKPLVSVLIPTFNYAHFIGKAIQSVLDQDYPAELIEIIVVDDGSTDNTREVLDGVIKTGRIQYFLQANSGKANATSNAIYHSKGDFIFNLDADDYFVHNKISSVVKVFESDSSVVHVGTCAKHYNQDTGHSSDERLPHDLIGKAIGGNELLKRFYTGNFLYGGGSTYSARASVLRQINIPDGVDMFIDEFLILAVLPFGKSWFIGEPLSVWRQHSANYSVSSTGYERSKEKERRLLNSTSVMLNYLRENKFDRWLIDIYRLKAATMQMSYLETAGTKRVRDIVKYSGEVFLKLKPRWEVLRNYHVLNRLIPLRLFNYLKSLRK